MAETTVSCRGSRYSQRTELKLKNDCRPLFRVTVIHKYADPEERVNLNNKQTNKQTNKLSKKAPHMQ